MVIFKRCFKLRHDKPKKKKDKKIKKYIYKRKEKKNNKGVVEGSKSHQNLQRLKNGIVPKLRRVLTRYPYRQVDP